MPRDIWERLWDILYEEDEESVVYVYALDINRKPMRPFILKRSPDPGLPDMLRDHYGGGEFRVLIRRGRKMLFKGDIAICRP